MIRHLKNLFALVLVIAALFAGYRVLHARIAEEIYRARLEALLQEHQQLREQYNAAVKKTAVTELLVEQGRLAVVVRSAAGVLARIDTPYDPRLEIHVDYVVLDGRLWIRRVHDSQTPPDRGILIDPALADVAWDGDGKVYGLSVYRPLDEGRWVVSVTSNGALTLARRDDEIETSLSPPPPIREYRQIEAELQSEVDDIGIADVVRALRRRLG